MNEAEKEALFPGGQVEGGISTGGSSLLGGHLKGPFRLRAFAGIKNAAQAFAVRQFMLFNGLIHTISAYTSFSALKIMGPCTIKTQCQ